MLFILAIAFGIITGSKAIGAVLVFIVLCRSIAVYFAMKDSNYNQGYKSYPVKTKGHQQVIYTKGCLGIHGMNPAQGCFDMDMDI
jgi:hypothetical protein